MQIVDLFDDITDEVWYYLNDRGWVDLSDFYQSEGYGPQFYPKDTRKLGPLGPR